MAQLGELAYSVEETPPPAVIGFSTLQHVAVMSSSLLYPVILATEAGLRGEQLFDLVALSMVALGVDWLIEMGAESKRAVGAGCGA